VVLVLKGALEDEKVVDISDTMDQKLAALYAYACQTVLTIDEFLDQARAVGVDEAQLAHVDPTDYRPWIDGAMRAIHRKLGAEIGVAYAESFRYQRVELPEFFSL
jgi:LmbE family N-acetylglucosaminyl deacetylase